MTAGRLWVRWRTLALSVTAAVTAAVTALVISGTAIDHQWAVDRLVVLAWLLTIGGMGLGSSRMITVAAAPALGAAMLGLWPSGGAAWGSALLIGCLCYVTTELSWAAEAAGDGVGRSTSLISLQIREGAIVVILTVMGGTAAALIGRSAPTRTLLVQIIGLVVVLAALAAVVVHLGRDEPSSGLTSGQRGDRQDR